MLSPRNSPPNNTPRPPGTKATGLPSPPLLTPPPPSSPDSHTLPCWTQGSPVPRLLHQTQTGPTCSLRPSHSRLPRSPGSPKPIQQQHGELAQCQAPGSFVQGSIFPAPTSFRTPRLLVPPLAVNHRVPGSPSTKCPRCACLSAGLPAWKRGGSPHGTAVLVSHVPSRLSSPHQSSQSTAQTPVPPSHQPQDPVSRSGPAPASPSRSWKRGS